MGNRGSSNIRKLPVESVETNIKGIYSFVPPPKGVDLTTASRMTLLKHGIFFRRPDREAEPRRYELWERFVREIWTEDNFVVPVFGESSRPPSNLRGPVEHVGANNALVPYWSGVAVQPASPQRWVGAMGVWNVPQLGVPSAAAGGNSQTPAYYSSTWVGLDGAFSGDSQMSQDVLQAGVENDMLATYVPQPSYSAWVEWYTPAFNYEPYKEKWPYLARRPIMNMDVAAGDQMSVVLQFVQQRGDAIGTPDPQPLPTGGSYHFGAVLIVNVTQGLAMPFYLSPPAYTAMPSENPELTPFTGDSAEWIMELTTATAGQQLNILPKFSPIKFTIAAACDVFDAPPSGNIGVELENGVLFDIKDHNNNIETNSSADEGGVTIEPTLDWAL